MPDDDPFIFEADEEGDEQEVDIYDPFSYPFRVGMVRLGVDSIMKEGDYLLGAGEVPGRLNRYTHSPNISIRRMKDASPAYHDKWVYRVRAGAVDEIEYDKRTYVCRSQPLPLP